MIVWGKKKQPGSDGLEQDYDSVSVDGQEIRLYDFINLRTDDPAKPWVGLVVRLWESRVNKQRNVVVRWLYRPEDLSTEVDDAGDQELFLALSSSGQGAEDTNDLNAVEGKCDCRILYYPEGAKQWRPTQEQLGGAQYYVSRCYDLVLDLVHSNLREALERIRAVSKGEAKEQPVKKKPRLDQEKKTPASRQVPENKLPVLRDVREKKSLPRDVPEKKSLVPGDKEKKKAHPVPAKRHPDPRLKSAFKQPGWNDKLDQAFVSGKVLKLVGFGAGYTAQELKEALVFLFPEIRQDVEVSLIPPICSRSSSSQRGEAVLAFRDVFKGNHVLDTIEKHCVIFDEDAGPCAAMGIDRPAPKRFPGHLPIEKYWRAQSQKIKEAVSTAHFSQANTIEYEMAFEWRVLEEEHRLQIERLDKQQVQEVADLKAKLSG